MKRPAGWALPVSKADPSQFCAGKQIIGTRRSNRLKAAAYCRIIPCKIRGCHRILPIARSTGMNGPRRKPSVRSPGKQNAPGTRLLDNSCGMSLICIHKEHASKMRARWTGTVNRTRITVYTSPRYVLHTAAVHSIDQIRIHTCAYLMDSSSCLPRRPS